MPWQFAMQIICKIMGDFSNSIGIYIKVSRGEVLKIRLLGLTLIFNNSAKVLLSLVAVVAALLSAFEWILPKDKENNLIAQTTDKLGNCKEA